MGVTFTATPDLDLARVAIRAEGGVVGDSFYVLRRDRAGSTMVRETSETGLTWQADPAATKTNQHTNPRWATVSGLTELRRNLATNPRCMPGTTATERRRNLAQASSSDAGSYGFEYAGGSGSYARMTNGGAHGNTYMRQTWNTASTAAGTGGTYLGASFSVSQGRIYYLSTYVRTSFAQVMSIGLDWRNSSGTLFGNSRVNPVSVPAYSTVVGSDGTKWTRIQGFVCAPPGAANGTIIIFAHNVGSSLWPAGSWLDTDSTLCELIDTTKRPYRVNRCADPSFENGTTFVTSLPGCTAASDTAWARSGTKSLKLTPTGGNVDSSCAIDGDTGAFRMGMYPGGTFTASGYIRIATAQANPGSAARIIKLYYRAANGVYNEIASPAAPNLPGVYRVSVTMTIPSDATEAFMRVYNGSGTTTDVVWWDDIQLEDGSVATPFFKGDTAPGTLLSIAWNGSANGSMSMEFPARIDYFDGSTGFLQNNGGEDLIPSWTGTVGDSQSILTSRNVPLYPVVNATAYSARNGTAVAVIPNGGGESSAAIDSDVGGLRLGMVPGKTYTVRARLTLPRVQAGTLTSRARKIIALTRVGTTGNYTEFASAAAPNVVGDYDLSLTFTVPTGSTDAAIRLYNASSDPNDVVLWSRVQVSEQDGFYFDGSTMDTADFDFSWAGTQDASASIMKAKVPTGTNSNASIAYSSVDSLPVGMASFARFEVTTVGPQGFNAVDLPAVGTSPSGPKTWLANVRSSKALSVQPRWRTAAGATVNAGPVVALAAGVWTEIRYYSATAPADSGVSILLVNGPDMAVGDRFDIAQHAVINGDWQGDWFDGSSQDPNYNGWNGAANASTSYLNTAALPITVYDYEARQGLETGYALTSDMGIIGEFTTITVPNWGSWLKDPFRPFMNTKILWNSDSTYTRKSDRVLLRPKGAKFPVPQWDKRSAPSGTVRVATETNEDSRALTSLLDGAGVIMIDVPEEYGVPVRYVSVGDINGSRVGEADRNLTWEARYFDLEVDEIDVPVGEPVGQAITYESVGNYFGSYLALAASVSTYDELASGTWAANV